MSIKDISLAIIDKINSITEGISFNFVNDEGEVEEIFLGNIDKDNYVDYKDQLENATFVIDDTNPTDTLLKDLSKADVAEILSKLVSCNYITNYDVILKIVEILLNLKSAQKTIGELTAPAPAPVVENLSAPVENLSANLSAPAQPASAAEIEAGPVVVKLYYEQIIQAFKNKTDPEEYVNNLVRLALNQKYNVWNQGINILSGALISVSNLGQSILEFFKTTKKIIDLERTISERDAEIARLNLEIASLKEEERVPAVQQDDPEERAPANDDQEGDEDPNDVQANEAAQIHIHPDAPIHNWVGLGLCGTILTFALIVEKLYYIMSEWDDMGIVLFGNFVFCPILMMIANWMSYRAISEFITVKFDAPLFRQVYQATDVICALYIAFYRFYTGENNFSVSRLPTQAFYIVWAWFAALVIFHTILSVRAIYSMFREFCVKSIREEGQDQHGEELREKWIGTIIWRLVSQWVSVLADWDEVFYSMKIAVITVTVTVIFGAVFLILQQ